MVHVHWEDPGFAQNGWMHKSEFSEWAKSGIPQTDSVGLLAYENDTYVVLIQSVGKNQVADGVKINRASIKSIREIGTVEIDLKVEDD